MLKASRLIICLQILIKFYFLSKAERNRTNFGVTLSPCFFSSYVINVFFIDWWLLFSHFYQENRKCPDPFTEKHLAWQILRQSRVLKHQDTFIIIDQWEEKDCHTKGDRVRLTGDEWGTMERDQCSGCLK